MTKRSQFHAAKRQTAILNDTERLLYPILLQSFRRSDQTVKCKSAHLKCTAPCKLFSQGYRGTWHMLGVTMKMGTDSCWSFCAGKGLTGTRNHGHIQTAPLWMAIHVHEKLDSVKMVSKSYCTCGYDSSDRSSHQHHCWFSQTCVLNQPDVSVWMHSFLCLYFHLHLVINVNISTLSPWSHPQGWAFDVSTAAPPVLTLQSPFHWACSPSLPQSHCPHDHSLQLSVHLSLQLTGQLLRLLQSVLTASLY